MVKCFVFLSLFSKKKQCFVLLYELMREALCDDLKSFLPILHQKWIKNSSPV